MDEKQAQLEWEARAGRPAAAAAFAGAVVSLAAFAYSVASLPHTKGNKTKDFLPDLHNHSGAFIGSTIANSIALVLVAPVLYYLYRAAKFRRPQVPSVARGLAIAAPIALALVQVVFLLNQIDAADKFVAGAIKTNKHAEDLVRTQTGVTAGLSLAGRVAVGFAFILISLNAMRAGLLSRFMGVLGIIIGALFVLPLVVGPFIEVFWLGALGLLFIGRWPSPAGRGPAWDAGEVVEWPTAQSRMLAKQGAREDAADAEPAPAEPQPQRSASTRSRKRKKKKARR
ncbi:MAG: hypothetical protein ACJ76Z_00830 [Thermoleophilaceae bacterium]